MSSTRHTSGDVVAHFDRSSAYYAARRSQEFGFQTQLRILDRMLAGCSGRIMDLGCGSGAAVPHLRSLGFDIVGVDFSPEMLAHAHHDFAGDGGVRFCRSDAESLPFASESFDHLVCLGLLEYLGDHERAVREAARVLRPGGTAVFSIPNGISPYHLTRGMAFGLWRWGKSLMGKPPVRPPKRNMAVPRRFRRVLRDAGLEPLPDRYCAFFVFPVDMIAPRLHARTAPALEFLTGVPLVAWTGAQYMVSARKAPTARTPRPARETTIPERASPR